MSNNDPAEGAEGYTIPFAEYRKKQEANDNIWWYTSSGHQLNLFEEACSIIDKLEKRIEKADNALDETWNFDDLEAFADHVRNALEINNE